MNRNNHNYTSIFWQDKLVISAKLEKHFGDEGVVYSSLADAYKEVLDMLDEKNNPVLTQSFCLFRLDTEKNDSNKFGAELYQIGTLTDGEETSQLFDNYICLIWSIEDGEDKCKVMACLI